MKNRKILLGLVALLCVGIVFIGWKYVYTRRGIPFVGQKEQWTIGIYRGSSPLALNSPLNLLNPVLKAEHVTDVPADFVADPFLIKEDRIWYLFFEVYNKDTRQGDLAVATSSNTFFWKYQKIILDEPFHLSYPYVFKWEDDYYLIPESYEDQSVRLYRATEFPIKWSLVTKLIDGKQYVDNSIIHYNNQWWLFACTTRNDTLHLYFADELTGPWTEHPASPIVTSDVRKARPSGRVLEYEGRLYRFTMDLAPPVGTHQVVAYEITNLTTSQYTEVLAQTEPIIQASGSGWNAKAMHQLDPVQVRPGYWIASVDGYGTYLVFGTKY